MKVYVNDEDVRCLSSLETQVKPALMRTGTRRPGGPSGLG
jgi:hypothetical protein